MGEPLRAIAIILAIYPGSVIALGIIWWLGLAFTAWAGLREVEPGL